MKIRTGLTALIPPALLAIMFGWQLLVAPTHSTTITFVGIGMIAGLAPLLCSLAEGRRGFHVNVNAIVVGVAILAAASASKAAGYGLRGGESITWVFTQVIDAVFTFGGVLLTGSLAFGKSSNARFTLEWKQSQPLLSVAAALYAVGLILNTIYRNIPHNFAMDFFDSLPTTGYLAMILVQNSLGMLLVALTPLVIPAAAPAGGVKFVMKVYSILFSAAALLVLTGFIVMGADSVPLVQVSRNPITLPFRVLMDSGSYLSMVYAVLIMAGITLRLGFGRKSSE
jgi:hypothetical protein